MKKLADKLKLFRVTFPLIFSTIKFRVKVFFYKISKKTTFFSGKILIFLFGLAIFFSLLFFFFLNSPSDFPVGTIFRVEQGSSLRSVSLGLKEQHIIRSRLAFEAFVILFGREKGVVFTDYYFEDKLSVYEVAHRISRGEHHMAPIVVTVPEGFTIAQIADTFAAKLTNFDKNKFTLEARGLEGYLFPDTYFFLINDDDTRVLSSMRENFNKKMLLIKSDTSLSRKTEKEIITMASLIEGEAEGDTDRAFISGILWKRLTIGMPLQVDSSSDTYKKRGLPESPINNPGLEAIKAAIYPQSSPYLYYLHDKNGVIHYARTFQEHTKNKLKYLTH